jgi:hypothetical protein
MNKNIRVELEIDGRTECIFDDYIKPGGEVWVLVPRHQDATAFIYEDDKLVKTLMYEAW